MSELLPSDFSKRQKLFLEKIKGGIAFLPSAPEYIRNNDVTHPYRQCSNLLYLTGLEESHSYALFNPQSKTPFTLFVQPKDKVKELWEGKLLGPAAAIKELGADAAFSSLAPAELEEKLVEALLEADRVYYRIGVDEDQDKKLFSAFKKACRKLGRTGRPFWPILDPLEVLGEMRQIKSKPEQQRLEKAAHLSAEAHTQAMKATKAGMFEYEIEAILFHTFRALGAGRLGYESIVASGPNACVLHYRSNNRKLQNEDLLLIDAGAEYDFYTADITRTMPVSAKFTTAQAEIYRAVLLAQKECIKIVRPGKTMKEIHETAVEVLTEELIALKILKGKKSDLIQKKLYHPYYPHGTGHWLGMDVHDVGRYYQGTYDKPKKLEAGMVFTIEPGLYFSPSGEGPSRYKGTGIRIEDDILVTSNGCKVLTSGVPKEIEEIESLRQNQ
jgi:Xaa-Pro aminopeptidase